MRVIGITGGVGAGKSTVLSFLEKVRGVRVVQADAVGHLVMEPGEMAFEKIRAHFGKEILDASGKIDRAALAAVVFGEEQELAWLNSVVHPAVKEWMRRETDRARESGQCRLFVIEAALLIEDHYEELCEEFWYIYAPDEMRRDRLKSSRGYTDARIDAVFASQQTEDRFRACCKRVIDNSGSPEETRSQVMELLREKEILPDSGSEPEEGGRQEEKGEQYR